MHNGVIPHSQPPPLGPAGGLPPSPNALMIWAASGHDGPGWPGRPQAQTARAAPSHNGPDGSKPQCNRSNGPRP